MIHIFRLIIILYVTNDASIYAQNINAEKLHKIVVLNGDTVYGKISDCINSPYFKIHVYKGDTIGQFITAPYYECIANKKFSEAIEMLKKEISLYPEWMYNYQKIAMCYYEIKCVDSAVTYLLMGLKYNKNSVYDIVSDKNLQLIFNDPSFKNIEEKFIQYESILFPYRNAALNYSLYKVYYYDQSIREEYYNICETHGNQSKEADSILKLMSTIDSLNTNKIVEVIDQYGYPVDSMLNSNIKNVVFLVLLHSDINVQKRYLNLIKKESKKGKIQKSQYAYLYDKIKVNEGEKQKFGTQIIYNNIKKCDELYPVKNLKKINCYRKQYDMDSIENYLKHFSICN
jgi:tetratricopeptide (TPR) repeat protein